MKQTNLPTVFADWNLSDNKCRQVPPPNQHHISWKMLHEQIIAISHAQKMLVVQYYWVQPLLGAFALPIRIYKMGEDSGYFGYISFFMNKVP